MTKLSSIGIDIGGTKTLFALFDGDFKIIEEIKIKTLDSKNAKEFTEILTESVGTLVKRSEKSSLTLTGAGIGCAGSFDPDGTVTASLNIPFLKRFPLRNVVAKVTSTNVVLANDCDAGLYGEYQLGAAV